MKDTSNVLQKPNKMAKNSNHHLLKQKQESHRRKNNFEFYLKHANEYKKDWNVITNDVHQSPNPNHPHHPECMDAFFFDRWTDRSLSCETRMKPDLGGSNSHFIREQHDKAVVRRSPLESMSYITNLTSNLQYSQRYRLQGRLIYRRNIVESFTNGCPI